MRALVLIGLFLFSFNAFATENCEIVAPNDPEFETGMNRETICGEVAYTLSETKDYNPAAKLFLTVTGRSTYSVSLTFKFDTGTQTVRGIGMLFWYPGDKYFVVTPE
jgi:hypothetical protein